MLWCCCVVFVVVVCMYVLCGMYCVVLCCVGVLRSCSHHYHYYYYYYYYIRQLKHNYHLSSCLPPPPPPPPPLRLSLQIAWREEGKGRGGRTGENREYSEGGGRENKKNTWIYQFKVSVTEILKTLKNIIIVTRFASFPPIFPSSLFFPSISLLLYIVFLSFFSMFVLNFIN